MRLKKLAVAVAVTLGTVGVVSATTNTADAAKNDVNPGFRQYKTMPKPLRGTWQEKSYGKYKKGIKVRWTYKFNKNSYSMKMDFKGGHKKSKTIKFSKKEIGGMYYDKKHKTYDVYPGGNKVPKSKLPYASYMTLKPVRHSGKKALALYPIGGSKITYFYWK